MIPITNSSSSPNPPCTPLQSLNTSTTLSFLCILFYPFFSLITPKTQFHLISIIYATAAMTTLPTVEIIALLSYLRVPFQDSVPNLLCMKMGQ